jgi:hypothetical protein
VRDNTPTLFEPNVSQSLGSVAQPSPPPDPLGEVDPEKSRRFTVGSAFNALWKVVLSGEKAGKTVEGWSTVITTLGPNVVPILEWLRSVLYVVRANLAKALLKWHGGKGSVNRFLTHGRP